MGPGHNAMSDSVSLHIKLTVTSELFHPFTFAAGAAVAVMLGEALSRFMLTLVVAVLPALSTAVPVTTWLAPFVDTIVGPEQEAIPDEVSAHVKLTVTFELFQPLEFGAGLTVL